MTTSIGNFPVSRNSIAPPSGGMLNGHVIPSISPSRSAPVTPWSMPSDTYTLKTVKETFSDSIVRDLNSGAMRPEIKELVDAVLYPEKSTTHKVQVKTFAVDGIQANDLIVVQRVPSNPNGLNIVLYMPDQQGASFHGFKNTEDMNTWLKEAAADPVRLDNFALHFAGVSPERANRVKEVMTRFKDNDSNAVVGAYALEGDDIFTRLDKKTTVPPAPVNGLADLQWERESPEGRSLYSGRRADGERVFYEYDAYGNLLGKTRQDDFYFAKNGLASHELPSPITHQQFKVKVSDVTLDNVGANDLRGFYKEFIKHLEHPAYGMSDALQVFGIKKDAANTVERYLDNPVGAALVDLNKDNQLGKVFGVDKQTMDADLKGVGNFAQGFVPVYGQARMLGALTAKALKNEPLTQEETRNLADALSLKPGSPARKNLDVPGARPSIKQMQIDREQPSVAPPHPENPTQAPGAPLNSAGSVTPPETTPAPTGPEQTPEVLPGSINYPGMKQVEFQGKKYFVADNPDAGDGEHYLLRIPDPKDPAKLVSSSIVAKPNEAGGWERRGVRGGGDEPQPSTSTGASAHATAPFKGVPIKEGTDIGLAYQKPAEPEQIFELKRNPDGRYTLTSQDPRNNKPFIYKEDQALAYVVRADEPETIYVGSLNKSQTPAGKPYRFSRESNPVLVQGHTGLAHGLKNIKGGSTDVAYAGTIYMKNGKVEYWTNESGHYQPDAELRHTNLSPKVKALLPEETFLESGRQSAQQDMEWQSRIRVTPAEEQEINEEMNDRYQVQSSDSELSDDDESVNYANRLRKERLNRT
ncbi:hypothetical protein HZF02_16320 [Pseudomonas yamanorum]|nr:hypothetical protein HZF02_16320 [Pseudomonas yamanorum]